MAGGSRAWLLVRAAGLQPGTQRLETAWRQRFKDTALEDAAMPVMAARHRYGPHKFLDLRDDGNVVVIDLACGDQDGMAAAIRFALDHRDFVGNLWQARPVPKPALPTIPRAAVAEAINDAAR